MEWLPVALPALGCLVMMPAMMWFMSRGMKGDDAAAPAAQPGQADEVQQLRRELERLRSELDPATRPQESSDG